MSRKGIAMVMALGVLSLLALIGTVFAINSILERKQAWNYINKVKARYLAEGGLARAIAELKYGSEGVRANAVDTAAEVWYSSGYSDSSFFSGSGSYSVAVVDCASRINLNDQNTNLRLSQILQNLNAIIGASLTVADCDNIAFNRPYSGKEEVKMYLSGSQAEVDGKYAAIEPYITIYGFVDGSVVNPIDLSTPVYPLQPRAPVNVNTASQQVIQAVLTGLRSNKNCPNCGGDGYIRAAYGGNPSCSACNGSGNLLIDSTEAQALAQYIVANRPYSTWRQFYASIQSCPSIGPRDSDLVMANSNPNTGFSWIRLDRWARNLGYLGKYVLDFNYNHNCDSADPGLAISTTEFSFDSGGYYEINSTGAMLASRQVIGAVAKIYDIYRETTQAQFEAGTKNLVDTYPEPFAAGVSAATYDGQIMLAKKAHTTPNSPSYFRADYRTTVNADAGGGNLALLNTANKPNISSVVDFSSSLMRGELQPDGDLIDYFDTVRPYYYPVSNISPSAGTIEIWFKPKYNSFDSMIYGDSDQDRKMFRFTSGISIPPHTPPNGLPFETFFFWSDNGFLWAGLIGGGGYYNGTDWSHVWGWQWGWTPAGVSWDAGKWNQLVVSWSNPPDPMDPTHYTTSLNPIVLYINGTKRVTSVYYYHTPYTDSTADYAIMPGFEYGQWNGNQMELSNAIIGSVRIWNSQLTDNAVQAEYNSGLYEASGDFTSPVFSPGSTVDWGTITWTSDSGGLVFDVDTGSGSFAGNWASPGTGQPINASSNSIKYRASLRTSSPYTNTPVLEDVTITYLTRTQILYYK